MRALNTTPCLRLSLAQWAFIPNLQTAIAPTAAIHRVLRNHPAQKIRPFLKPLRFQHSHMYKTQRSNRDPDHDNPQSPPIHALHNVARSLNIPSSHHSLANLLPTDGQLYNRYLRTTTMCPCSAFSVPVPGTPRMCEHCNLLRLVVYHTTSNPQPRHRYNACALTTDEIPHHHAFPDCIVYILLRQNKFLQRWHDIQEAIKSASPLQTHRSIHSLTPVTGTTTPHHHSGTPNSSSPSPTHSPRHIINLKLNEHIVIAIDKVLAATMAHDSVRVHLSHPQLPVKLSHLRRLQTTIRPCKPHHLPVRVLYHHLLISAQSPLIPQDMYLSLTMDNNIHTMTPNGTHDQSK